MGQHPGRQPPYPPDSTGGPLGSHLVLNFFHTGDKVRERVLIEKPAHTQVVYVGWFASFWQVGVRSTLGVDTKAGG